MLLKREDEGKITKALFQSSNILEAEYNVSTATLIATFNSGRRYKYNNVARSEFTRLLLAESQGKTFNEHIIKNYKADRLEDKDTTELLAEAKKLLEELNK